MRVTGSHSVLQQNLEASVEHTPEFLNHSHCLWMLLESVNSQTLPAHSTQIKPWDKDMPKEVQSNHISGAQIQSTKMSLPTKQHSPWLQ